MRLSLIYISLACAIWIGCEDRTVPQDQVVAQVNDVILTKSEIETWELALSQLEIPNNAKSKYIRDWVVDELLVQKALEQGLNNDPWVSKRIENVRRALLIQRILELETNPRNEITPQQIKSYYKEHSAEFVWEQEHFTVQFWRSGTIEGMSRHRQNLLRGDPDPIWTGKANSLEEGLIQLDGENYSDPDVWNAVRRLKVSELSKVVSLLDHYWLFRVLSHSESGDPKSIELVESEIKAILREQMQRKNRDKFIQELIAEYRDEGKLYWTDAHMTISVSDSI